MRRLWFILALSLFYTPIGKTEEILTKKKAYELMKENGFKWKATSLFEEDAKAKSAQASSQFYPMVNLVAREFIGRINPVQFGGPDSDPISTFTAGQTALQIYYDIFDLRAYNRVKAARWNEKMSDANRDKFRNDLTYIMLASFLNAQRLKKKVDVLDAGIKRSAQLLKIAQERLKSGAGLKFDLLRAKTLREFENLRKLEAELSYDKAIHTLALILGRDTLPFQLEPLKQKHYKLNKNSEKLLDELAKTRPDVLGAEYLVNINKELEYAIRNERVPRVSFLGDAGVLGTHNPLGVGSAFNGTFGVQISMPLLSFGLSPRADQEHVQVTKAELDADQAEIEARSDIRQSIKQLEQTEKALQVSKDQIQTAEEELKVAELRYSAGSISGFEYNNSRTNFSTAQDSNIEAVFLYELAKVNYFKATAGFDHYFALDGEP